MNCANNQANKEQIIEQKRGIVVVLLALHRISSSTSRCILAVHEAIAGTVRRVFAALSLNLTPPVVEARPSSPRIGQGQDI